MKSISVAVAFCLLLSAPVRAEEEERFDVRPDWLKRPNGDDVMAVWPKAAWEKGQGGRAVIVCRISLRGVLTNCSVDSEEPAGAGFGMAAIALAPQFLLKPGIRDGKPVESSLRLPIIFSTPGTSTGSHIPGAGNMGKLSLSNVIWRSAPTYDQVVAAYPEKAREKSVSGRATLNCKFTAGGRLGGCDTIQEEPKGQGFAAAAKAVMPHFLGPDVLPNGASTKGAVTQITFVFDEAMLDPEKRVVGKPSWARLPTGGEVAAGYPSAAVKAGVRSARVLIRCEVGRQGHLSQCAVQSEEPAGYGFATSALTLAPSFQVKPWSDEGLPMVGAQIRVPIRFQLPDEAPASK